MNQEHISKIIKDIRQKYNLTQKDLADTLGVTYQAVSKWENGRNIPDIEIINLICKTYNIDINEFLNGKKVLKKHKTIIILSLIIILLTGSLIVYKILDKHNFEFKKITTTCDNFKVIGSIAYNKDKTSIYIANVSFCDEDKTIYKSADCNFYEEYNGEKNIISNCNTNKENITISEYLDSLEINVDDYNSMCKTFKNTNLYLEINGYLDNKITTYKIPLTLNENCD